MTATYMADPQTSGPRREASPAAEDDARIEHLLVTGLDHYFAGEFEQAINLWTRVLFLDRTHDRARAYIDRARSAQAERQRISEALVHEGLDAFDKGEVVRARELLSDALDQGASHDVALGVLGRIDRLEVGQRATRVAPSSRRQAHSVPLEQSDRDAQRRTTLARWWLTAAAIVAVAAISFVIVTPNGVSDWFPDQATTGTAVQVSPAPAPLPIPAPTDAYLAQARTMFASGKLRDALRALDRVPVGDTLRADADRLRGDIQRELLAVATAEATSSSTAPPAVSPPRE
jgi:predicted transcriptional regulator